MRAEFHRQLSAAARCVALLGAVIAVACAGPQTVRADEPRPAGDPPAKVIAVVDGYDRGQHFNVPAGIYFDARRAEVYVADRGNHRIAVFGKDGLPLRSFVHSVRRVRAGKVLLQPGEPGSVAVNSRGDIFIVDGFDDAVDVVDYRGRSVTRLRPADLVSSGEGSAAGQPVSAIAVAVDDQDRVYIATTGGRCEVIVLDRDYRVIRRIGKSGRERGAFSAITGISVDRQGRILVTDAQSVPVQVFSASGELLSAFGAHDVGWQNFSFPSGAVRDGKGDIWVVDAIRQVVKRFDDSGRFRGVVGGFGTAPGDTYYPVAIAGDEGKLLFVLEKNGARFQVFQVVP